MLPDTRRDQSGAVLILALIFVVVTGVVGVALASLTSTNLAAATGLQTKRGVEFNADAGVDAAIQLVRYNDSVAFTPGTWVPCAPGTPGLAMNGATVYVSCTAGSATAPTGDRAVEFFACGVRALPNNCSTTDVTAQVVFDDYSASGSPQIGTSVTIVSWNVSA
jgi:hypothetical protein